MAKKVAPAKKEAVKSDKAVKSKDTKATKSKTKSKDDNPSTLETAVATAEQAMETVVAAVEPAVESVVAAVEPAVEAVVDAVEPVVDAVESAVAPASKGSNKGKPKSKDSAGDKAATASANRGVLQLGSGLPKIVLKNEDGEDVDVSTLGGERGVVIFLYPRVRVCVIVCLALKLTLYLAPPSPLRHLFVSPLSPNSTSPYNPLLQFRV